MARKLRKLVINEISLVDKGANQHAFVTLFKRDTPAEIETPRDADLNFGATGNGPAHDKLWVLYDNYRRQMGPAQSRSAFEAAWRDLSDDEKQEIRNEEAATEAARQAQAAADEKERREQMDSDLMIKGAHAVASGAIENVVRKSTWHGVLRKMAAERQEPGESIERAVARIVKTDADALALFRASVGGVADDAPAPALAPAPVLKAGTAYARLHDIGAGFMAADPNLTREQAFAKAFNANPNLAKLSKTESAFA